jgi:SpoIID/LytB domain protein
MRRVCAVVVLIAGTDLRLGPALKGSRQEVPRTAAVSRETFSPVDTVRVGIRQSAGGYAVATMPLEVYVARVVAGEAARDSQPAALEALAIAVRTFALANLARHRADGFDLCDQTHCQVVRTATAATQHAAAATAGRVLLRDGLPAPIYYTASCGGRTEIPSAVWPGAQDPPFLPSRVDDACGGAPSWSAELTEADLLRAFRAAGFVGKRLRHVGVLSRNGSGRVARLSIEGLTPDQITGQDLRVAVGRTLGWQYIKSTAFDVRRRGSVYRFTGHGFGHGVGLCVIGSARLAAAGKTPEAILSRYFPGLTVADTWSESNQTVMRPGSDSSQSPIRPRSDSSQTSIRARADFDRTAVGAARESVVVSLPDEDEGERDAIVSEAIRARDELARALGVVPPTQVVVRFHSTTGDYERATGQPWFTSSAVVNGELHLLPVVALRERGTVDRTMRRALLHLMIDDVLARRPAWVREGTATFFADGGRPVSSDRGMNAPCPADNELLHPVSIGALSNAHSRARACVAKQIAAGRSWRDVR